MWKSLQDRLPTDGDYPLRVARLTALERVLDGTIYDMLRYAMHEETDGSGQYVRLRDRRPSVRYNLCKQSVRKSASMLFSEAHMPEIDHPDDATAEALRELVADTALCATLAQAVRVGSVGSVALWLRVLSGRIYVDVLPTKFLTPHYDAEQPDKLASVVERRKLTGAQLAQMGYAIAQDDARVTFWWQRVWTDGAEEWYAPQSLDAADKAPKLDADKTVQHGLGFVPVVWIRNLPSQDAIDGAPTFDDEAIATQIDIEYQLSQGSRALRYAGDPLLLIKEPATDTTGNFVRSASNALIVNKDGDAKLVEIDGAASEAVINYVKYLAQITREQLHLPNVDPDRMSGAQSGRALELLHGPLIQLCDALRVSYGTEGLCRVLEMIVTVGARSQLLRPDGSGYGQLKPGSVSLRWPRWFDPTPAELGAIGNALHTHTDAGHMSRDTAISVVAPLYGVQDVAAEKAAVNADLQQRAEQAPQVVERIDA